jgi:DNA-binding NarL/FixJ family response regulator
MEPLIRVVVVEDRPLDASGFRANLSNTPDIQLLTVIQTGDGLLPFLESNPVDVLILDVMVPTSATNPYPYPLMHLIPTIQASYPEIAFLIVSNVTDRLVIRSILDAGASGYILKDDVPAIEDLPRYVRQAVNGGFYVSARIREELLAEDPHASDVVLTPRQREVLSLCAAYPHFGTAEIGKMMGVSDSTARNLLSAAYVRLEVPNRHAAVVRATQLGLLLPPTT